MRTGLEKRCVPEGAFRIGRIVFGLTVAGFGAQYLLYGHLRVGMPLVPAWISTAPGAAYLAGFVLLVLGVAVVFGSRRFHAATALAALLSVGSCLHMLRWHSVLTGGDARTSALECLALAGAAWALAADESGRLNGRLLFRLGEALFCFAMLVFGVQHFLYLSYVAMLVPGWIPAHRFWVVFTGLGFMAAAVAIVANRLRCLAAVLLSSMFLGWVLLLHLPRIASGWRNGDEWSSGLVALALCGGTIAFARTASERAVEGDRAV